MHLGNTVATVGFPGIGWQGFAPKFARGEIASLSGAADDARYFQVSLPVQKGSWQTATVRAARWWMSIVKSQRVWDMFATVWNSLAIF